MTHATGRAATRGAAARAACLTAVSATLLAACSADPTGVLKDTPNAGDTSTQRGGGATGVNADVIPDQYIVTFADSVRDVPGLARQLAAIANGSVGRTYAAAVKGFAGKFSPEAIEALQQNPRVVSVEQDRMVRGGDTQYPTPTWGVDRVDQRALPLDNTFTYGNTGSGVNVYILDTGIRTTHREFTGRAFGAYTAINDGNGTYDCNGHGTHVAGTVGSRTYGVAKGASLHAVRVLDCSNWGSYSGIIAGIDWVTANRVLPAVANMSLGGSFSTAVNSAVQRSISAGVTYVISAMNDNVDACNVSPASTPQALTVGATDRSDARATFSNFGACLDIFAPGVGIVSAFNASDSATASYSGTSMAAPHVAGAAALVLGANPSATPAQVDSALGANASAGSVINPGSGSVNRLLFSGFVGNGASSPTPVPAPAPTPGPSTAADRSPTASLAGSCSGGRSRCNFDASASTDDKGIVNYTWLFGDGSTPIVTVSPLTAYIYRATGTYTVTVRVTDGAGQTSASSRVVTVRRL